MKGRVLLSLQHGPAIIAASGQLSDNWGKINAAVARNCENALTNAGDEVCAALAGLLQNRIANILQVNISDSAVMLAEQSKRISASIIGVACIV
ncbi:hypothetical protein D3C78_1370890 [compost metagenome]